MWTLVSHLKIRLLSFFGLVFLCMRTSHPSFRSKSITEKLVSLKLGCALITIQVLQHVSAGNCPSADVVSAGCRVMTKQTAAAAGTRASYFWGNSSFNNEGVKHDRTFRREKTSKCWPVYIYSEQIAGYMSPYLQHMLAFNSAKPLKKPQRSYFFPGFKNCHSLSCKHHRHLHKPDAVIRNRDYIYIYIYIIRYTQGYEYVGFSACM